MASKRESSQKDQDGDAIRAARINGRYTILAALITGIVGAAAAAAFTNGFGLFSANSSRPTVHSSTGSHCSPAGGAAGIVQPSPKISKSLTFCPVLINDGSLPITGAFDLSGQVLGPLSTRRNLVLIKYFNPRTCDALGNAPALGGFFVSQVNLDSPDGVWSYTEELGYPEAVTLGRKYEYVSASFKSIQLMRGDRAKWQASGGNPRKYPGIPALPGDAVVLATFDVPPGLFNGNTAACKNS